MDASTRMTGNNELISNIDTSITSSISLGDDHHVKASGKGIVSILSKQNEVKTIYDVYYVPTLVHNLLSVGWLLEHGYEVIFHDTICTILDKLPSRDLVARVKMNPNRLFPLEMRSVNLHVHHVSNTNETVLWHNQYGHLPFENHS